MTSSLPRRPEPSQKRYCQVPPLYPAAPPHWWRGPFPLVSRLSPSTGLHPLKSPGLTQLVRDGSLLALGALAFVHLSNLPDRGRNIIITIVIILVLDFENSVLRAREGQ